MSPSHTELPMVDTTSPSQEARMSLKQAQLPKLLKLPKLLTLQKRRKLPSHIVLLKPFTLLSPSQKTRMLLK